MILHDRIPALIAALAGCKQPDRNLDADIAETLGHRIEWHQARFTMESIPAIHWAAPHPYAGMMEPCPNFTGSIDESLKIAKRTLSGAYYIIAAGKVRVGEPIYGCRFLFGNDEILGEGEHDVHESLAILIALFVALQNQSTKTPPLQHVA